MPDDVTQLTEKFRRLGAPDPHVWASSQIDEGIPQLHRFLFLRAGWTHVVAEGDTRWIKSEMDGASKRPDAPGASIGPALTRVIAAGADPRDIAEIVRVMQWQMFFDLCNQLDDSSIVDTLPREGDMPDIAWGLFAVNEDGDPQERIAGLHESVLELDPSGREMRPPPVP